MVPITGWGIDPRFKSIQGLGFRGLGLQVGGSEFTDLWLEHVWRLDSEGFWRLQLSGLGLTIRISVLSSMVTRHACIPAYTGLLLRKLHENTIFRKPSYDNDYVYP